MIKTEGVICVLKPPGMSSSDAVTDVRRVFDEKRVGHTGTLDPAAAGVLPICIGRATRLFDFLVDKRKEYIAELVFGQATDTEDATGTVTASSDKKVSSDELKAALPAFIGEIEQTPPIYSALSINGEKLYKLARKGEITKAPEVKKRVVTVSGLELIEKTGEGRFLIRIECSKGTYIRTLCKDIGEALGVPAHMAFLLRTRSGAFTLEDSYSIAELREMKEKGELYSAVIPMDRAVSHVPELRIPGLPAKQERLLIHGAPIPFESGEERRPYRVYLRDEFLGLGEIREKELRITVWLGDEAHQIKGMKISGTVCEHNHIGSTIGFPTANLAGYDKKQLPPEGVYATVAVVEGGAYKAVTSIGTNPTVGGESLTVETHMIGFEGDCYGKPMTVRFVKRLRGMMKFGSVAELRGQIASDVKAAEEVLENSKYTEII
ncbi:MAG: tRNA pseudouridine(55) synthase TruB [Clostridiales bacterium]|nr:tRNA pseudouridine(55) synthase TruB [Clostridiales bacterium]